MFIKNFVSGGLLYFEGIKTTLSTVRLIKFALLPLLLNILFFATFIYIFASYLPEITSYIFSSNQSLAWYITALKFVFESLLFIISIIVVFFCFTAVGLIIASPFNDMLSSAVEQQLTKSREDSINFSPSKIWFVIKNEAVKLLAIIAIELIIILTYFVPLIGPLLFTILNGFFVPLILALEFIGYPLDRQNFSFKDKLTYIRINLPILFGFGTVVALMFSIPFINLIVMPFAVTAATILTINNRSEEKYSKKEEIL